MRQVVGFGDWYTTRKGVLLGANLGRAIVTNGDLLSQRHGPLSNLLWADLLYFYGLDNDDPCRVDYRIASIKRDSSGAGMFISHRMMSASGAAACRM